MNYDLIKITKKEYADEIIDNITTDNVTMISDHFSACNLYCMYSLYHDDEEQKISEFNEDLLQFSDTAVWIKDVNEFKNRVKNAIEIECVKGKAGTG